MSTIGWVVIGVLGSVVIVLAVVVKLVSERLAVTQRRVGELESTIVEFGPLLADTRSALRKAESRTVRADDLVHAATSITTTADAASKFAYSVATNPVVRIMAWGRGMRRGAEALRTPSQLPSKQNRQNITAAQRPAQLPPGKNKKSSRRGA
jgi:hypothetical protein